MMWRYEEGIYMDYVWDKYLLEEISINHVSFEAAGMAVQHLLCTLLSHFNSSLLSLYWRAKGTDLSTRCQGFQGLDFTRVTNMMDGGLLNLTVWALVDFLHLHSVLVKKTDRGQSLSHPRRAWILFLATWNLAIQNAYVPCLWFLADISDF